MSLFSFVQSAGRLLGVGHAQAATQDESKPAPPPPAASEIKDELSRLGLGGLDVAVEGDTVKVSGTTPDQATREKAILAAGNIAGIAKVDDAIQTQAPAPEAKFHTVVKGDTLSAIAKQEYGNANKYPAIFEANKPMLGDPNKIYPGQVLRIPTES
jgi:nucleoid-associated protein YgaU